MCKQRTRNWQSRKQMVRNSVPKGVGPGDNLPDPPGNGWNEKQDALYVDPHRLDKDVIATRKAGLQVSSSKIISLTGSKGGLWCTDSTRLRSQGGTASQIGQFIWATPWRKILIGDCKARVFWKIMDKAETCTLRVPGARCRSRPDWKK